MAAYAGYSATFYRAAIDGDELANLVVIANFEAGRFAGVGQILRRHPDRAKWKEGVVDARSSWALRSPRAKQMAPSPSSTSGPTTQ